MILAKKLIDSEPSLVKQSKYAGVVFSFFIPWGLSDMILLQKISWSNESEIDPGAGT